MDCDRCGREAVMRADYAGSVLCGDHLCEWVERRIRRRVRDDGLLPRDATPDDPERWVIGLSGGKDSAVLAHVLDETFADDPRVDLIALSIHEGIEGYRDDSLQAAERLVDGRRITHRTVSYADEFGVGMDEVVTDDPLDMAACAYCGVFRRDLLSQHAADLDADKLLTGHNLDDEAQTALMNLFEGDLSQVAKHFDASLGPFDAEHGPSRPPADEVPFVPRAKPLRDVPEREVALYAHCRDLPAHVAECPHAAEAYRGEIRDLLLDLEADHPGTRHSIMAGYAELAGIVAAHHRDQRERPETAACDSCGAPTTGDRCRSCELLDALAA